MPGAPLRESEGCIYLEAQISEDFLAEFSSRISASTPVYQILEVSPPFFVVCPLAHTNPGDKAPGQGGVPAHRGTARQDGVPAHQGDGGQD